MSFNSERTPSRYCPSPVFSSQHQPSLQPPLSNGYSFPSWETMIFDHAQSFETLDTPSFLGGRSLSPCSEPVNHPKYQGGDWLGPLATASVLSTSTNPLTTNPEYFLANSPPEYFAPPQATTPQSRVDLQSGPKVLPHPPQSKKSVPFTHNSTQTQRSSQSPRNTNRFTEYVLDTNQKLKCPSCGQKFTGGRVDSVVRHVKKHCRMSDPTMANREAVLLASGCIVVS